MKIISVKCDTYYAESLFKHAPANFKRERKTTMKKRMIAAMLTAMTALSVFGVTAMADDDELVLFTWENMFPQEVLDGFTEKRLDILLREMKAYGVSVPYKAIVTEHNIGWSLSALFAELVREHEAMHQ